MSIRTEFEDFRRPKSNKDKLEIAISPVGDPLKGLFRINECIHWSLYTQKLSSVVLRIYSFFHNHEHTYAYLHCWVHATVQVIYEAHKRSLQEWALLKSRVCWRRKLSHSPLPRWSARISHLSSNWARCESTRGRMHVWLSMLLSMASRKCKRFREILTRACALSLSRMFPKKFLFSNRNRCGCSLPTRSSMPTSFSVLLRSHVDTI